MYESERGNIITEECEATLVNEVCLNVSSTDEAGCLTTFLLLAQKGEVVVIGGSFRVALVVGFGFLHQTFGKVVGTYKCHLQFCECGWGGGSTWR